MIFIESTLTTFEASFIFWGSWGSIKNWLELKIDPPSADLALLNPWNTLYLRGYSLRTYSTKVVPNFQFFALVELDAILLMKLDTIFCANVLMNWPLVNDVLKLKIPQRLSIMTSHSYEEGFLTTVQVLTKRVVKHLQNMCDVINRLPLSWKFHFYGISNSKIKHYKTIIMWNEQLYRE